MKKKQILRKDPLLCRWYIKNVLFAECFQYELLQEHLTLLNICLCPCLGFIRCCVSFTPTTATHRGQSTDVMQELNLGCLAQHELKMAIHRSLKSHLTEFERICWNERDKLLRACRCEKLEHTHLRRLKL